MTSFFSMFVWVLMGAVLVKGIVLASGGVFWLLIVGLAAFALAVLKFGILPHH